MQMNRYEKYLIGFADQSQGSSILSRKGRCGCRLSFYLDLSRISRLVGLVESHVLLPGWKPAPTPAVSEKVSNPTEHCPSGSLSLTCFDLIDNVRVNVSSSDMPLRVALLRAVGMLTGSLLPWWMQVGHEDGVIDLPEESFEHVGHILDEVVPDTQLHIPGILSEFVHQKLDPGLGPVFPVYSLVTQAWEAKPALRSLSERFLWFSTRRYIPGGKPSLRLVPTVARVHRSMAPKKLKLTRYYNHCTVKGWTISRRSVDKTKSQESKQKNKLNEKWSEGY